MGESVRRTERVTREWFEALYAQDPDPWGFCDSEYERRKYDLTVAALPRSSYRSAFEPGCSLGGLTRRLAGRAEHVLATDIVAEVVARAAASLVDQPHVTVEVRTVPDDWPARTFDLVVLSELGYYLTADELEDLIDRAVASLEPGGDMVAVHWLGQTDYPLSGAEVHARIEQRSTLERIVRHEEPEFELRCWRKR